ncbi:MAG: SDR family NAD(P)-dependent oxidoreductase [Actinobacteria bacterium]|nr:SDR family NAD(P)-dependent oxidoreductase [Actinomycetota bacterium]MSY23234.1 SDR family NAD(P)-dependent oxidoreductase [Actinomycetota bacterium]
MARLIMTAQLEELQIDGAVAVVTGGANGIGKAIVTALLGANATVVIADIEEAVLSATVAELSPLGAVTGIQTDVTDESSVTALADQVFEQFGRCNLLFLNAGVTSGGGGLPWEQEPNDWRWCFGVNVFGTGICSSVFIPRMIKSAQPGQIIVTSSKDGGVAPVPTASIYAASKAALTCFAESLDHNLINNNTALRASVFYPSGGLLDTGLYSAARNRPEHLQRQGAGTGRGSMSFDELVARVAKATGKDPAVADLDELAEFVVEGVRKRRFIIARDLDATAELLHQRADAIGRGDLPPQHGLVLG